MSRIFSGENREKKKKKKKKKIKTLSAENFTQYLICRKRMIFLLFFPQKRILDIS